MPDPDVQPPGIPVDIDHPGPGEAAPVPVPPVDPLAPPPAPDPVPPVDLLAPAAEAQPVGAHLPAEAKPEAARIDNWADEKGNEIPPIPPAAQQVDQPAVVAGRNIKAPPFVSVNPPPGGRQAGRAIAFAGRQPGRTDTGRERGQQHFQFQPAGSQRGQQNGQWRPARPVDVPAQAQAVDRPEPPPADVPQQKLLQPPPKAVDPPAPPVDVPPQKVLPPPKAVSPPQKVLQPPPKGVSGVPKVWDAALVQAMDPSQITAEDLKSQSLLNFAPLIPVSFPTRLNRALLKEIPHGLLYLMNPRVLNIFIENNLIKDLNPNSQIIVYNVLEVASRNDIILGKEGEPIVEQPQLDIIKLIRQDVSDLTKFSTDLATRLNSFKTELPKIKEDIEKQGAEFEKSLAAAAETVPKLGAIRDEYRKQMKIIIKEKQEVQNGQLKAQADADRAEDAYGRSVNLRTTFVETLKSARQTSLVSIINKMYEIYVTISNLCVKITEAYITYEIKVETQTLDEYIKNSQYRTNLNAKVDALQKLIKERSPNFAEHVGKFKDIINDDKTIENITIITQQTNEISRAVIALLTVKSSKPLEDFRAAKQLLPQLQAFINKVNTGYKNIFGDNPDQSPDETKILAYYKLTIQAVKIFGIIAKDVVIFWSDLFKVDSLTQLDQIGKNIETALETAKQDLDKIQQNIDTLKLTKQSPAQISRAEGVKKKIEDNIDNIKKVLQRFVEIVKNFDAQILKLTNIKNDFDRVVTEVSDLSTLSDDVDTAFGSKYYIENVNDIDLRLNNINEHFIVPVLEIRKVLNDLITVAKTEEAAAGIASSASTADGKTIQVSIKDKAADDPILLQMAGDVDIQLPEYAGLRAKLEKDLYSIRNLLQNPNSSDIKNLDIGALAILCQIIMQDTSFGKRPPADRQLLETTARINPQAQFTVEAMIAAGNTFPSSRDPLYAVILAKVKASALEISRFTGIGAVPEKITIPKSGDHPEVTSLITAPIEIPSLSFEISPQVEATLVQSLITNKADLNKINFDVLGFMTAGFLNQNDGKIATEEADYSVKVAQNTREWTSYSSEPRTVSTILYQRLHPLSSIMERYRISTMINELEVVPSPKVERYAGSVNSPLALPDNFAVIIKGIPTDSTDSTMLLEAYKAWRGNQNPTNYNAFVSLYHRLMGYTISAA
jgi:hypothetical protein